jgi:hypothetical protein
MTLPILELQVLRWEVREFLEKDENFVLVVKDGKHVVLDSWVVLTVAVGSHEFLVEVDLADFEKSILPVILDPMIRFWRAIEVGHSLFPKRVAALDWLLAVKAKYPGLCEP